MIRKPPYATTSATSPPLAISLAGFTSSVDRFAVSPLLVILAMEFGVSLSVAVTVASIYFFTYGLSQPFWGMLSDTYGRLSIMRIALLGALVFGLSSAFATNLVMLTITRALTGAFFGAIVPAAITYVGDTTQLRHRQSAMSDLMAAIAVGTALATAAAGVTGQLFSWRIVFAFSSLLALASVIALMRLDEPHREHTTDVRTALRLFFHEKWALLIVSLAFVEGALVLGLLTLLAPALETQGVAPGLAGLAVAAYGIATLLFSRLVRPLTARVSAPRILALGGLCLIIGLTVVTIQVSVGTAILAALMFGGTWAFMHTGLQSWVTQVLPAARGISVAFFAGMLFAGSAVSSAVAGIFAESGRWDLIFGIGAIAAVILTLTAVWTFTRYQRQVAPEA